MELGGRTTIGTHDATAPNTVPYCRNSRNVSENLPDSPLAAKVGPKCADSVPPHITLFTRQEQRPERQREHK